MKEKINKVGPGVFLGLIGPTPGFLIYYLILWTHRSLFDFMMMVWNTSDIQSRVLALSMISNLAIFLLAYQYKYDHLARGILFGTIIYVPIMMYLRFF